MAARWGRRGVRDVPTPGVCALEEPALCYYAHRLGARIDAQLVEDRGEMLGDGALGNEEPTADGLAGEALRHQPQHLPLAFCERAFAAQRCGPSVRRWGWGCFGAGRVRGDFLQ